MQECEVKQILKALVALWPSERLSQETKAKNKESKEREAVDCRKTFFWDTLTLEYETNKLLQNVGKQLGGGVASYPRKNDASTSLYAGHYPGFSSFMERAISTPVETRSICSDSHVFLNPSGFGTTRWTTFLLFSSQISSITYSLHIYILWF
jgi:hypothetical protein